MPGQWLLPKSALVVHNALTEQVPFPRAPTTDDDTVSTPREICQILTDHHVRARLFPLADLNDLQTLFSRPVEFIFNGLDDDIGDQLNSYHLVPRLAEKKKIPFSGGNAQSILVTNDKALTKKICQKHALLTPDYWLADTARAVNQLPHDRPGFFPILVKPVSADGSEGITQKSVVNNPDDLKKRVSHIRRVFGQAALIEKYIPGREISQSMVETRNGPKLFPLAELRFTKKFKAKHKIIDFHCKWRPNTSQFQGTKRVCPAEIPHHLARKINRICLKLWQLFRLQGHCRIDFRLNPQQQIFLLDINVNPDMTNDVETGFTAAALAAGFSYSDLVLHLVDAAMHRYCV